LNVNYTNPKATINLGFTLVEGSEEIFQMAKNLKEEKIIK